MCEAKNSLTSKSLCKSHESKVLWPFVEIILGMEYDQTPDYSKLRFMLTKVLLDKNVVPDKQFDWQDIDTSIN